MTRTFCPILVATLALAACADDQANRPYLDLHPAAQVRLDPDAGRIEHRQLVASLSPEVPAPRPTDSSPQAPQLGRGNTATDSPAPIATLREVTIVGAAQDTAPTGLTTPDAAPTEKTWSTTPGLSLRAQIRSWVDDGAIDLAKKYHLVDRDSDDPPEPEWQVTEEDSYDGDLLGALAWLGGGFRTSPRPDIEVTANRRILIHTLGAAR
jgi:hypothetical protein